MGAMGIGSKVQVIVQGRQLWAIARSLIRKLVRSPYSAHIYSHVSSSSCEVLQHAESGIEWGLQYLPSALLYVDNSFHSVVYTGFKD